MRIPVTQEFGIKLTIIIYFKADEYYITSILECPKNYFFKFCFEGVKSIKKTFRCSRYNV